ncbi:protoporphyrinogen oxidase [Canicola haemoglobinophilus]|uniref:Protoporphyrinogen oxidase n=1 Tax=Canicola haemoglobinophilus TaxID=733 RepID=A0A377HUJ3_9PAST|nr:protoporphyrinogen oxidase [Canicola haemoglobinophilus]
MGKLKIAEYLATKYIPHFCLLYRYSWFDRTMIKFMMKMTSGETDRIKEAKYTVLCSSCTKPKKIKQLISKESLWLNKAKGFLIHNKSSITSR